MTKRLAQAAGLASLWLTLLWPALPAGAQTAATAPASAAAPPLSAPAAEAAAPAAAVAPPPPEAPPPPAAPRAPATTQVVVQTSAGRIVIALETERAPRTAGNFLRYVDQKRFDGTGFYRAMKLGTDGEYGLIQGGVAGNPKKMLAPVAHESTLKTGLSHTDGAVSMARAAPGSAAGDFFITIGPLTSLDARPQAAGDNAGFAVFGQVVEGMEVVRKIQNAPVLATLGSGVMKGQMIADPVKILTVRRVK